MPLRQISSSCGRSIAQFARRVRSAWPRVMHAGLPNLCALCGNLSHKTLSGDCDDAHWNEGRLRCVACALPLASGRRVAPLKYLCPDCTREPPPFDATFALADYRAPLDTLAIGLKFRARLMLARDFAQRLARLAQNASPAETGQPDVIAPVPLAARRLAERGYNQAWQIAKPLARALGVRGDATLLERTLDT